MLIVAGCATQEPGQAPGEAEPGDQPGHGGADDETEPTDNGDGDPDANEASTNDADQNDTDDERKEEDDPPMQLNSHAFADEDPIPPEHSNEEGNDTSPPLTMRDVPDEASTLALIVDDPDAPTANPFVHWLIWNIPAEADTIAEGYPPSGDGKAFPDARQGTNDFGNERYNGPAPPQDDGPHRYRFTLYALDRSLSLEEGAQRAELENAMEGAILANVALTGTYDR